METRRNNVYYDIERGHEYGSFYDEWPIDETLFGKDIRPIEELLSTQITKFSDLSKGYGVKVTRKGQLDQVILPTRIEKISNGKKSTIKEAPVVVIHSFTSEQAQRVVDWLARIDYGNNGLGRNASELRKQAVSIALAS